MRSREGEMVIDRETITSIYGTNKIVLPRRNPCGNPHLISDLFRG